VQVRLKTNVQACSQISPTQILTGIAKSVDLCYFKLIAAVVMPDDPITEDFSRAGFVRGLDVCPCL